MKITKTYKTNRAQIRKIILNEMLDSQTGEMNDAGESEEVNPHVDYSSMKEDSGEEEAKHYDVDSMSDDEHIDMIRKHLDALEKDKDYDEDHVDENLVEMIANRLRR